MKALDAILSRRSIRKFTGELISDDDLKVILQAGFSAPSAHNRQPWEFIVLKDDNIIETIAENHKYAKMLPNARRGIIVCGDYNKQKEIGFLVADCSAAIQNILLSAHALGLGAVWCGIYPKEDLVAMIKGTLGLPEEIIPIGLVAIGVKDEEKDARNNYDESKIHIDKWTKKTD